MGQSWWSSSEVAPCYRVYKFFAVPSILVRSWGRLRTAIRLVRASLGINSVHYCGTVDQLFLDDALAMALVARIACMVWLLAIFVLKFCLCRFEVFLRVFNKSLVYCTENRQ